MSRQETGPRRESQHVKTGLRHEHDLQRTGANRCATLAGVSLSEDDYAPGQRQPMHAHHFTSIGIVIKGGVEERFSSHTEQAGPCSVVIKPPGVPHSDRYSPNGARMFAVRLPEASLAIIQGSEAVFQDYNWFHGGPIAAIALRLYASFRSVESELDLVLQECLCEMAAEFDSCNSHRSGDPPRWLTRIVELLEGCYCRPLQIRDLAREAEVHPVYLARAFRRWYGCSISEYIRRRRVKTACGLMASTSATLTDVALQSGFADQPHFNRIFKAETGMTPNRYRRLLREG